jgi:hypothetical protein
VTTPDVTTVSVIEKTRNGNRSFSGVRISTFFDYHIAMNKAFVREPDSSEERCPACGAIGQPVQRRTVELHARPESVGRIASVANFCPTPRCDVVYFDMFERTIPQSELRSPVYPKDPQAPICACFGLTVADIDQDLAEGTNQRTKACVLRAQSAEANCEACAPNGRSCVAAVQGYFLQRRGLS